MYWFRNNDGSCSYGTICLGKKNAPYNYVIKFPEKFKRREDEILKNSKLPQLRRDDIYDFLYGHPEKEFVRPFNERYHKLPKLKEWNSDTISNIDFNMFLLTFIIFIDSNSDFNSKLWETIKTIYLLLLNQHISFFEKTASVHDCSAKEFFEWLDNFISNETYDKVLRYLTEDNCYICYTSLCNVKDVLIPEIYDELEERCCEFFDKIALKRINTQISLPRDLDELFTYSIDNLFFYSEYFKLKHSNPQTNERVNDEATFLYTEIAKILIKHKYYLQAQRFLEDAKKIYATKAQLTNVIEIEYSIKKPVEKLRRKQQKKQEQKERKETKAHRKKCKLLYNTINKTLVKLILPGGIEHLDCVMNSLSKIISRYCTDWTTFFDFDYQKKVFSLYSDGVVRLTLSHGDMKSVINTLKNKHPSILKTDALSAAVVAFVLSNMMNNQFEIVTDEDIALIEEAGKELLEAEKPKNDKETEQQHLCDAEYGLVVTKPIYTMDVSSSYAYLEHLVSLSGEKYKWVRLGSTSVQGVNGMIDMYEGTLPSGEKSPIVYVNMYGSENSHSAPIGFMYVD